MTEIEGKSLLTVTAAAGEEYGIKYDKRGLRLDISNNTDGDIYVSPEDDFTSGEYLVIPASGAYNDFGYVYMTTRMLYIKSLGSGDISIAVRRY